MIVVLGALPWLGFSSWRGDSLATTAALAVGLACGGFVYAGYFWARREN